MLWHCAHAGLGDITSLHPPPSHCAAHTQVAARHISAVAEGPHPIADDAEKVDAVMRYARSLRSKSES